MALILNIETATKVCSVALAENDQLILEKHAETPRQHAQLLTVLIDQLLQETKYDYHQLDAICVSKGPGSYTGLRIGVAVAKGLCFALDKPLMAVNTLFSMSVCLMEQFTKKGYSIQSDIDLCPLIDARRMEVYTAIYDKNQKEISATKAMILDDASFMEYKDKHLIFFGDGAAKMKGVINPVLKAEFIADFQFSAIGLIKEGSNKYRNGQFEDMAYFEPFYLKEFVGIKGA